jgi:type I restriction enzyme, R subunit
MPSNFDFLQPNWATLLEDARQTEQNVFAAPRTCAFYARRTLERMVKWLYAQNGGVRKPYQDNLAALIHEPTFRTGWSARNSPGAGTRPRHAGC